jgi:hypothetical protein
MERSIIARSASIERRPVSSRVRDAISNGRLAARSVDLRSAPGRRFTFLVERYAAEIGGMSTLGEPEKALIKQICTMQLRIEQMQGLIIGGADVDADAVIRLSSEHRRLLATLKGKADKAKPAPDDALQRYLAERYSQPDDDVADDTTCDTETEAPAEPEAAENP